MSVYKSCFFTGHRSIAKYLHEKVREDLREKIRILIKKGVSEFITGGSWGFDMMCAEEVIKMRKQYPHIRLHLFLPCNNHNIKWSEENKRKFEEVKKLADSVIDIEDRDYFEGCMHVRNRSMVNSAMYCIAYCKYSNSGTAKTLEYAREKERIIVNIG